MDIPPPPSPAPPAPSSAPPRGLLRARHLGADLVDLLLVGGLAVLAGVTTLVALEVDDPSGFENLGVFFLAALVAAAVGLLVAVVELVATARSGSLGDRVVGRHHDGGVGEVGWRLARWVALVGGLVLLGGGIEQAWQRGLVGTVLPPLLTAAGAALGVVGYLDGSDPRWARAVAAVAAVGAVLGIGAVVREAGRELTPTEVRLEVEAAAPEVLEELGARRVCSASGVVAGPAASHTTAPCFDPDEVWHTAAAPDRIARDLAAALETTVPGGAGITLDRRSTDAGQQAAVLRLFPSTIAFVTATECGTRVRMSSSGNVPLRTEPFLPDVALAGRCV